KCTTFMRLTLKCTQLSSTRGPQQMSFSFKGSSKGFVSVQEQKNWTEAQKHCREKHTDLASVRNESENHQIKIIASPKQDWIGLYRSWVWSDNSNFTFTHWKSDEPNIEAKKDSICASTGISDEGRWTDEHCRELHHFVLKSCKLCPQKS
uniref:C-type lectin domain-containing protein n=1 Tax=Sinocyclocheilus rhinocerous TaxID=307959 RepID=A0A673KD75_9TELE